MGNIRTPGVGELLTLDDYLRLCKSQGPQEARRIHLRTAWGMLRDMIDSHGHTDVVYIGKKIIRPNFFDGDRLGYGEYAFFGGDEMLAKIVTTIRSFAESRDDRMVVLLKGPASCAKSVLGRMLKEGLIQFSREEDGGARYTHHWVLPESTRTGIDERRRVGFLADTIGEPLFSPLDADGRIKDDYKAVSCQLRNSPIRIFPRQMRIDLFREVFGIAQDQIRYEVPAAYREDCCPNCDSILEHLMNIYANQRHNAVKDSKDRRRLALQDALRHVVVERYAYDQAGSGIVTIPVHGQFRSGQVVPITDESKYRDIIGVLRNIDVRYLVFQKSSHISSANGIMVIEEICEHPQVTSGHENDFFSKGEVDIDNISLLLDTAVIGTTNIEPYEQAIADESKNPGAKTRWSVIDALHPIRVQDAIHLYERKSLHKSQMRRDKHIAPYTAAALGIWSTLCRLEHPKAVHTRLSQWLEQAKKKSEHDQFPFSDDEMELIKELSPMDKANLYDGRYSAARVPKKLARLITDSLVDRIHEASFFEGLVIPTREVQSRLIGQALEEKGDCLLPLHILSAIETYVEKPDAITDTIFRKLRQVFAPHYVRSLADTQIEIDRLLRLDVEAAIAHQDDAEAQSIDALIKYIRTLGIVKKGEVRTVQDPRNPSGQEIPPQQLLVPFEDVLEKGEYFKEGYKEEHILRARQVIFDRFHVALVDYRETKGQDYMPSASDTFYPSVYREVIDDYLRGAMYDPLSVVLSSRDLFVAAVEQGPRYYDEAAGIFRPELLHGKDNNPMLVKVRAKTATYLNMLMEMSGRGGRMDSARYCAHCAVQTMHYVLVKDLLLHSIPESKRSAMREMMYGSAKSRKAKT